MAVVEGSKWEKLRKFLFIKMLRRTGESGPQKDSTVNSTESLDDHQQQRRPQERQDHFIEVDNNGGENFPGDKPSPTDSEWVISIKEKLKQAGQDNEAFSRAKLSSHRIPHYLKDGRDRSFVPQIVSVGPYHHGDERLHKMDQHKWRCLHRVLRRTNHKIVPYLDSVKQVEERARAYYDGRITMSSDDFLEMMVLDGFFVIELFWGCAVGFDSMDYPPNDPVFSSRGSVHMIRQDMIMLENQIPLFILDLLFNLQRGQRDEIGLLSKLALQFFYPLTPTDSPPSFISIESMLQSRRLEFDPLPDEGDLPCLELFRRSLLYPGPKQAATQGRSQKRQQLIHCVTDLRKKGINFKKGETDRFWDIQFKNGTLKIPPLLIHDGTKSLFLNLIAFEQGNFRCSNDITSYVVFMDNLINSAEDVGHLHDRRIIEHWLGSDTSVSDLFNQLCQEVVFDINDSYLSQLSEDVNAYYSRRWHSWMASLKFNYFSNPWSIISLIAAFILLVLTFAQTFYGVYGYYRPPS